MKTNSEAHAYNIGSKNIHQKKGLLSFAQVSLPCFSLLGNETKIQI